jgi:hypothetical protein
MLTPPKSMLLMLLMSPTPDRSDPPGSRVVDWIEGLQRILLGLIEDVPHLAVVAWSWWPRLVAATVVYVLARMALFGLRLWWWPRMVAAGYWAKVTPPRELDPGRDGKVWRTLHTLALRAQGPWWHLVRPPLVLDLVGHPDGRVEFGLWLPAWVPFESVAAELAQCWPGCQVTRAAATMPPPRRPAGSPPAVAVAGRRLAATVAGSLWLVDDPHPHRRAGTDSLLGGVFTALAQRDGTTWVQVLARPASRRDLAWLGRASRQPQVPPRGQNPTGRWAVRGLVGLARALVAVVDLFLPTGRSRPGPRSRLPVPEWQRERMREAGAKLADGPHLLATIRVAAVRANRRAALDAARLVAASFGVASVAATAAGAAVVAGLDAGASMGVAAALAADVRRRAGRAGPPATRSGLVRVRHRRRAPRPTRERGPPRHRTLTDRSPLDLGRA